VEKSIYTKHLSAFRAKIVAMRHAADLTQRDLARKLGRVPSVVAHIEQGQRRVDTLEFYRICKACGVSPGRAAAELMRSYDKLDRIKKKPLNG
jgi:transcriptional regulator with XRE-family HTH domain